MRLMYCMGWCSMKSLYAIVLLGSLTNAYTAQLAKPLQKTDVCPTGYVSSGGFCNPIKSARFAVQKTGVCPASYVTSGGFCLSGRSSRAAIPKIGICLSGWSPSGDYCLKNR